VDFASNYEAGLVIRRTRRLCSRPGNTIAPRQCLFARLPYVEHAGGMVFTIRGFKRMPIDTKCRTTMGE
jgi:hypothetical protein